jgi:hypothetical protein
LESARSRASLRQRSVERLRARLALALLLCVSPAVSASPGGEPNRVLRGVVVDALGAVVPGAVVTLRCGTIRREAVSDGAGRFDLAAPSNGPCLLAAEAGALAAPPQRVAPGAAEPVTLELRLKPFTAEIVVTPSRGDAEQSRTAPETTGVIERTDLVSRPHQILPQTLREEPGVLVQQTTSSQGSPIVRGLTGQGNLYLVDGTRHWE